MKYFSALLPPPNITGELHLGHFWNATLQDTLIRFYKSKGIPTYWAVGIDHAGISFQSKYWKLFKEGNQEKINEQCIKSKEKILEQFKSLNFSFNIKDFKFTYDEESKQVVKESFEKLIQESLIFRDYRPIHWDPILNTAISDEEITYKEEEKTMYYLWYYKPDNSKYIKVGTTEPETIPWDVALFTNTSKKEYCEQQVLTPYIEGTQQSLIPILCDDYVDSSFGTGIMKCSPLKDPIDYELAIKHNIPIKCYARSISREDAIKSLKKYGSLEDKEIIKSQVPYSSKSEVKLEKKCSEQLFLKSSELSRSVLKHLTNNHIKIHHYSKQDLLIKIFESMRNWCISRQIQWGIKLPDFKSAHHRTKIEGIENNEDFRLLSKNDVLDTWFSSSLWPITMSKGKENYFPFSLLISGQDILAPWIAKMIFMTHYFKKELPFKEIYLHGLVLDKNGQKMSKSKGNGIDPIIEAKEVGTDALKLFFLENTHYHANISYSREKINKYSRFLHKLSNAYKFLKDNNIDLKGARLKEDELNIVEKYFLQELRTIKQELENLYKKLEFSILTTKIIDFIHEGFCNKYLEFFKLKKDKTKFIAYLWNEIIYMLRPIAPTFSENIYKEIHNKDMPEAQEISQKQPSFDWFFQYMKTYENIRKRLGIPKGQIIKVNLISKDIYLDIFKDYLKLLNNEIQEISQNISKEKSFLFSIPEQETTIEILPIKGLEDKFFPLISERINWLEKEIIALRSILNSNKFTSSAPKELVEEKKSKLRACEYELEIYRSRECTC